VRRGVVAFGGDFLDHGQGALARRAAGAVGDGKELRLQHRQPLAHGAQLFHAFLGVRGKELDRQFKLIMRLRSRNQDLGTRQQLGEQPGNHAVQCRADDARQQAIDHEAVEQPGRQQEHQAVDDEDEQAQRKQGHRQRQQHQQRPDHGIDQAEHQRHQQRRAEARHLDRRQQPGQGQQGGGVDQPGSEQAHGSSKMFRAGVPAPAPLSSGTGCSCTGRPWARRCRRPAGRSARTTAR
jgi:hypothetical protein